MSLKRFFAPLAAAAALAVPVSASAQWQLPAGAAPLAYSGAEPVAYYQVRQAAYDEGYREGARRGEEDARRGDRFSYQDERDFQRGDKGYHRGLGDRERYRQIFRDGFAAGYSDGFSRFSRGRYPQDRRPSYGYGQQGPAYGSWGGYRNDRYYSPAFDNGMRDGYEKGQEDARKNRSFDPRRHKWYREGDHDYEGRYGPRETYKDAYRRAFQQAYERAYREGRYRW